MSKATVVEMDEMRLVTQRGVSDAPLPVKYEAARAALAECSSVDECASWAKKAAALASYARQSNDDTLEKLSQRSRARAVRRCGELLKEIPAKAGQGSGGGTEPHRSDRAAAARAAGLSTDQTKDAIRVARIPGRDFEEAVESDNPPTVTELAARGTLRKPLVDLQGRDPAAFNRSLMVAGDINDLAERVAKLKAKDIASGCLPRQVGRLRTNAIDLAEWLTNLVAELEDIK